MGALWPVSLLGLLAVCTSVHADFQAADVRKIPVSHIRVVEHLKLTGPEAPIPESTSPLPGLRYAKSVLRVRGRYYNKSRPVRRPLLATYSLEMSIDCPPHRYIRLTSDRQGQSGWLFARTPMTATSWMVSITAIPFPRTQYLTRATD